MKTTKLTDLERFVWDNQHKIIGDLMRLTGLKCNQVMAAFHRAKRKLKANYDIATNSYVSEINS